MEDLENQPKYRLAGVISFLIGALLGILFEYVITLPFEFPSGLLALIVTIILYPIIYKITNDNKFDNERKQSLEGI